MSHRYSPPPKEAQLSKTVRREKGEHWEYFLKEKILRAFLFPVKKIEGSRTLVRGTRMQLLQGQRFHRQSCPWPRAAPVSIAWLFRQLAKIKASLQPCFSTWRNKKWLTVNHSFFIWKKMPFTCLIILIPFLERPHLHTHLVLSLPFLHLFTAVKSWDYVEITKQAYRSERYTSPVTRQHSKPLYLDLLCQFIKLADIHFIPASQQLKTI